MKYITLLLLTVVFSSCVMDAKQGTDQIVEDSEIQESNRDLKITASDTLIEPIADTTLFKFELIDPDTTLLKKELKDIDYDQSETYVYLHQFYTLIERDSIEYFKWEEISDEECSFKETFESEIRYYKYDCSEEGGISETVVFPRIENKIIKAFIQKLYETEDNTWTDEYSYEADGAGCYYNVTHTDTTTTIEIYCGC